MAGMKRALEEDEPASPRSECRGSPLRPSQSPGPTFRSPYEKRRRQDTRAVSESRDIRRERAKSPVKIAPVVSEMEEDDETENRSVVKVFCTHCEPNYALPWTTKSQHTTTSTGWVVKHGGRRLIMTNAHSVEDAAVVEVRKRGDDAKYIARILCIGCDCDLAILELEDDGFWGGNPPQPLVLRKAPAKTGEEVLVLGYPVGGDNLCVTKGIVSRIDLQEYSQGSVSLLAVQIDAAINPGNSGGPVLDHKGHCAGVAFQSLHSEDTENLGYIIPTEVVHHFLEDYRKNGRFTGFGDCGFEFQSLENSAMRVALGLKKNQSGVLVKRIAKTSHANEVLQKGDILLKVNGRLVGNDGTVRFRKGERIPYPYLMSCKFVGDTVEVDVLRGQQVLQKPLRLVRRPMLVPCDPPTPPEYCVIGGIVCVPLTEPFLKCAYGDSYLSDAPLPLLQCLHHGMKETEDHQVVIVTQVLASSLTVGFQGFTNTQVTHLNGTPIRNAAHLCELYDGCQDEWLRFALASEDTLVLNTREARCRTPEIMQKNMIAKDRQIAKADPAPDPAPAPKASPSPALALGKASPTRAAASPAAGRGKGKATDLHAE